MPLWRTFRAGREVSRIFVHRGGGCRGRAHSKPITGVPGRASVRLDKSLDVFEACDYALFLRRARCGFGRFDFDTEFGEQVLSGFVRHRARPLLFSSGTRCLRPCGAPKGHSTSKTEDVRVLARML